MKNNQTVFNSCFAVSSTNFQSNDLEDERTAKNTYPGVQTAMIVSGQLCCGDDISAAPATCTNCAQMTCTASFWGNPTFNTTSQNSTTSSLETSDGRVSLVCSSSRSGSPGNFTISYTCSNGGTEATLVTWSGTPISGAEVPPGGSVSEQVTAVPITHVVLAALSTERVVLPGSLGGFASTIVRDNPAPTLSQWGLIITALLLTALGTIAIRLFRPVMASAGSISLTTGVNRRLFVPSIFAKTSAVIVILAAAGLLGSMWLLGPLALRDVIGTLVCAPVLAYVVHLWIASAKDL